ncbi:Gldg family protein [Roseomonas aerophila]|uniref:Gldg family protein n=1 Tax=Teichococcus aerophilus TaxID=1224513 RepID=A0ABR7RS79_9PROT|nr:Gldg family protein [Pseudoroseomonas aerophila]MBC9209005.1 Gldg family protein [Pseudoroseomonas aerophila]
MSDTTLPPARPASRRLLHSAGGLLAVAVLAVGANVLADRLLPRARIDLTQQRLYTLSDGTRQVLAGLHDPITLRLFYSRRLGSQVPVYGSYADRVREMLQEYAAVSGGKIRLEYLDPEPFSETEDRALAYGIQGVPIDQSGEQVYFGLAGNNLLDDERVLPFFQPDRERFLEFDLTRLIYELSNPRRPVLGTLSALPLNGDPRAMMMRQGGGQPYTVINQLRQFFTVKDVASTTQVIDPDIQILLVAQPQGLSDATLYAIDQFVMRGGKLFVMTDPHSEGQSIRPGPTGQPPADTSSNLNRLLNAWGIETPTDKVVLDLRGAWRVRAAPTDRVQAVDYLAWFNTSGDALNHGDVATADLQQVTFASAGEVRKREGAGIEMTPLITSSTQSQLVDVATVRQSPNPSQILAAFKPDGQRHVLMARARGVLNTAFPDGPPAVAEGAEARPADFPAHRAQSDGPANLVIANDSDVLEDRFWVQTQDFFGQQVATPFSDNGALVANLADTLAGGDALIGLRSRGESLRPFGVVDDLRRNAEARYRQTEQGLTQKLQATEARLRQLRQGTPGTGERNQATNAVITPEQRAEIDRARAEITATRGQLRNVQLELRRDIESLETRLRIMNIAAVPALLTLFAIVLAVLRIRRRGAARA